MAHLSHATQIHHTPSGKVLLGKAMEAVVPVEMVTMVEVVVVVWTYCGGGGGGGSSYTDAGVTDLTHEAGQDQIAGNSADAQGAGQGGERSYNGASESGANGRVVIGW